MITSDIEKFTELMDGLSEYYRQKPIGKMAISFYYDALADYEVGLICEAARAHIRDTKHGSFYPKASDFIRHIDGPDITPEQIIAEARNPTTPLGCLARIRIGHFDLARQSEQYLKHRAIACLKLLPGWKKQAVAGNYDNHALGVMRKFDVNPDGPLGLGLPGPSDQQLIGQEKTNG